MTDHRLAAGSSTRRAVDAVAHVAVGALVVLLVLVPGRGSPLDDVVGPVDGWPLPARVALVVAGASLTLAGLVALRRLVRERARPSSRP